MLCTFRMHVRPMKKEGDFFLGDQQLAFLLAFKRLINQFEQDLLKPPAASKGPENPYGRNRHTKLHNLSILSEF